MQFRLFYTAILVGLSSLLFRKNTKENVIRVVLLLLIINMYLLEVHFDDYYKRQYDVSMIKVRSIDSLVILKPSDST